MTLAPVLTKSWLDAALLSLILVSLSAGTARAQGDAPASAVDVESTVPQIAQLKQATTSEFRDVVGRYVDDLRGLYRRYDAHYSPLRHARLRAFFEGWQERLGEMDYEGLGVEERVDYLLLVNEIEYELYELNRRERLMADMADLLPFAGTIVALHEARRDAPTIDARAAADTLHVLAGAVRATREALDEGGGTPSRIVALRTVEALDDIRETLEDWFEFFDGYDPLFTWWVEQPYEEADAALDDYARFLREDVVGITEGEDPPIVGDPIGAAAMEADLEHEMIPYTPEELIAIAEKEFAWCESEMLKAADELGYGDDWRTALQHVKTLHVEAGEQPELVQMLADEAVDFLKARDLLTIPPLAEEIWRIEMMSPRRQKVNPFFTGGEVISVSFPTGGMSHADKLMSMRGNNIHFARATVHHELIPGHHLQMFMASRYNPHRRTFSTPFWMEGWALYWEMRLWDLGLPTSPEDRIGMLFWRMHRAARIMFSLGFHLGEMTPREAIDFLVDRVGHEPANARAEVRRSFNGSYPPLYQAAYMLGGLQIRALHQELVESGQMTEREFHDAFLRGGMMPIEMVRVRLRGQRLPRDYEARWRFYGDPLE